ncbi:hypothetical protein B0T18DRAFT_391467 [Schizothecium vesticola]|uniref:Uncharacterized protein n=1 Tax=Schizothecium vesticola TaxID=314040 RepID=A0AA40EX23_9PEZI|nr:hypothetical protein B0T18DRAFT_391467 [Schizothecium vesticola]
MSTTALASKHTPPSWRFTEFFWHSSQGGADQVVSWGSTRTGKICITSTQKPRDPLTNNPRHTTTGFTYADTRTLDADSLFITTRCTCTFSSGSFHPTVTITVEFLNVGIISKWIADTTLAAQLDSKASTKQNLYAEATPYRILGPPVNPAGNQPPTAPPDAGAGNSISPGAQAGITIGGVLLFAAAVFLLWRRQLAKLKSEQNTTVENDMTAGPGLEVDEKAASIKKRPQHQQLHAYELDDSQLAGFPVDADLGQEHGHEHELPAIVVGEPELQELPGTTNFVRGVSGEERGTG